MCVHPQIQKDGLSILSIFPLFRLVRGNMHAHHDSSCIFVVLNKWMLPFLLILTEKPVNCFRYFMVFVQWADRFSSQTNCKTDWVFAILKLVKREFAFFGLRTTAHFLVCTSICTRACGFLNFVMDLHILF
jgi:hypothetical protein